MSQGEAQETVDKLKVMLWANHEFYSWVQELLTLLFSSSVLLFRLISFFNEIHSLQNS